MTLRYLTTLILTLFGLSIVVGQETKNPFDIENRVPQEEIITTTESELLGDGNPFDIHKKQTSKNRKGKKIAKQSDARPSTQIDQLALAGLLLVPLAFLMTLFRGVFNDFFESVYRDRKFNQFYRRMNSMWAAPHIMFYVYFLISISVFTYLVFEYYGLRIAHPLWKSLGITALYIGVYFIAKHILVSWLGDTFEVKNESTRYGLLFMTFNIAAGVLLTPVNLLLILGPVDTKGTVIVIGIILLALTILLLLLRSFSLSNKLLSQHPIHFFAYLCSIELAPLFIVIKLLA